MYLTKKRSFLVICMIGVLLLLCALLTQMPIAASAYSGTEADYDYSKFRFIAVNDEYWVGVNTSIRSTITEANIPPTYLNKPVTQIIPNGFTLCRNLKSVTIPNSIEIIGEGAFADCWNLSEVYIASSKTKGVKEIGVEAFAYCDLQDFIIPRSVTIVGESAFEGNPDEGSITVRSETEGKFSAALATYGGDVVYGIDNLVLRYRAATKDYSIRSYQNIELRNIPLIIPFHNTGNKDSSLDDGLKISVISSGAFVDCELDILEIGSCTRSDCAGHTITLESKAFYGSSIKNIILSNSVAIPEDSQQVFAGSASLETVHLPTNLQYITNFMFQSCESLKNILTTETSPNHMPNTIKTIGNLAFEGCSSLEELYFDSSIDRLGNSAFAGCTNLSYLYISDMPVYSSKGGFSIGVGVFSGWTDKQTVEFGIEEIPDEWDEVSWKGGEPSVLPKKLTRFNITYNLDLWIQIVYPAVNHPDNPTFYDKGNTIILQEPTRKGYKFECWAIWNGENYIITEGVINATDTGDKIFAAHWGYEKYKITYDLGYESWDGFFFVTSGVITLYEPERGGHVFKGWYSDPNFKQPATQFNAADAEDKIFYAKWEQLYYVSFSASGYKVPEISNTAGSSAILPTITKNGYAGYWLIGGYRYDFNQSYTFSALAPTRQTATVVWTSRFMTDGKIYDMSQFNEFVTEARKSNNGNLPTIISLYVDITLSDYNWIPIPTLSRIFLGNNHMISCFDIQFNNSTLTYQGFFSVIESNGYISDLVIDYATCYDSDSGYTKYQVGALAGLNRGTIINCTVQYSNISLSRTSYGLEVGGFVHTNQGNIINCTANTVALMGYNSIGGIACVNTGLIENCRFEGGVICAQSASSFGGIVGRNDSGGQVKNCYSSGLIWWRPLRYEGGLTVCIGQIIGWNNGGSYSGNSSDLIVDIGTLHDYEGSWFFGIGAYEQLTYVLSSGKPRLVGRG